MFRLSLSVKWLAVQTASEMTYIYTVSIGALNSTPANQPVKIGGLATICGPVPPSVEPPLIRLLDGTIYTRASVYSQALQ